MKTLTVGDVFRLSAGMQAYVSLPEKYVYSNRRQSTSLTETNITVGEILLPKSKSPLDTSVFVGDYVVESTTVDGGGTGMGPHDAYPDGHHVFARKLKTNGNYNPTGHKISFYQSGWFTAMNRDVPVTRKMKLMFV